ncbi:MAG: DPP IV N-terminal domain-containing protein, partial [Novosphingobium sp.]
MSLAVPAFAQEEVLDDALVLEFPPASQKLNTLPNGSRYYALNGTVTNTGRVAIELPELVVQLRNAKGALVFEQALALRQSSLAPGEVLQVNEVLVSVPASVASMQIGHGPVKQKQVIAPVIKSQPLAIERVFASPSLNGAVPRGVKLSPDGRWLTVLKNRADDRERYDLWGFDRQNGKWRMLVDSKALSSGKELSEAEKMQRERQRIGDLKGVVTYEWNADNGSVLVPLDVELFRVTLDGTSQKLGGGGGDLLNPKLSPKGTYVSFVRDQRLWAGKTVGEAAPVSPEEKAGTVHWGEAEFVAQEEMARITGYWWAPDDGHIAVER